MREAPDSPAAGPEGTPEQASAPRPRRLGEGWAGRWLRRALAGGDAMPSVFGRLVYKGLWDDDDWAPTRWGKFVLAVQDETARLDDEWGIGEDGALYCRVGAS